jgi:hypothetical protein
MPAATYGQFNPGGIDPWPIESELAKAAATSPVRAEQLLENYQAERGAASNVYLGEMDTQHQFAQQQMKNQLIEAQMKAVPDYLKAPGGSLLLGAGGAPGMNLGADPGTLARIQAAGAAHEQSTNLAEAGKGIEGASAGGLQIAPEGVSALQGLNVTNLGTNARVQAELIKQQTEMAKASMKAKSAGAGGGVDRFSVQLPADASRPDLTVTMSGKGPGVIDRALQLTPGLRRVSPPGDGTAGGATSQPSPTSAPAKGGGNTGSGRVPGLQPAPGSVARNAAPGADQMQRNIETHLEQSVRTQNPQAYADIKAQAAKNGGRVQIATDPKTGQAVGVQGTNGAVYR